MSTDNASKPHVGICVVGHVDAGKSTLTGHLLYKFGGIDDRALAKLKQEAAINGKAGFEFAYATDTQDDERKRGITIKATAREFFTKYHYTIVDCPGHSLFISNMIKGSNTAEAAILMFPAEKGGFEKAIATGADGGSEGQTRQHACLINLSGIKQVICLINKMDDPSVNFSEERFNEIKAEAASMLVDAGYGGAGKSAVKLQKVLDTIPFIPISGYLGYNLDTKCDLMPWYKGFNVTCLDGTQAVGHTVADALDNYVQVPKREDSKPFRMPVSQIIPMPLGTVITGKVEQGTIKPGDNVMFVPSMVPGLAFSLEMHNKQLESAGSGDNIGVLVKKLEKGRMPHTGDVMVLASEKNVFETHEFTVQIEVKNHPGELKVGYCPNIMIRTAHSACRLERINWRAGKDTGKVKSTSEEHCKCIKEGDFAEVVFRPQKPLYVEAFTACEGLGRVALMDSARLVGVGRITSVTPLTPELKEKLAAEAKAKADAKRAASQQKKK